MCSIIDVEMKILIATSFEITPHTQNWIQDIYKIGNFSETWKKNHNIYTSSTGLKNIYFVILLFDLQIVKFCFKEITRR